MYNAGVYLFYNKVKPAATRGISGGRTAMKSANTVQQPYELPKFRRGGSKLTPGPPPGPSVFYLCNGQNLISPSRKTRIPDLISEGQKVVIYPQKLYGSKEQLRGCMPIKLYYLRIRSRWESYLVRKSGEVHWIGNSERGRQKNGHAQLLSDLDHRRQIRSAHPGRSAPSQVVGDQESSTSKVW